MAVTFLLGVCFLFSGCAADDEVSMEGQASPVIEAMDPLQTAPGRMLLLRLDKDSGLAVLASRRRIAAPRGERGPMHRNNAQYQLLNLRNEVVAAGEMRIPASVHALFGAVDGPARGVTFPENEPVFWIRFAQPQDAIKIRIVQGRKTLGEVTL